MDEELREFWKEEIQRELPADARLTPIPREDRFEVTVGWKIKSDPERPNKPSKTIRIIVPQEAVDDYQRKSTLAKANDDEKLCNFVREKMKTFDPEHESSYGTPPPEVMWVADTNVLDS